MSMNSDKDGGGFTFGDEVDNEVAFKAEDCSRKIFDGSYVDATVMFSVEGDDDDGDDEDGEDATERTTVDDEDDGNNVTSPDADSNDDGDEGENNVDDNGEAGEDGIALLFTSGGKDDGAMDEVFGSCDAVLAKDVDVFLAGDRGEAVHDDPSLLDGSGIDDDEDDEVLMESGFVDDKPEDVDDVCF